MSDNDIYLLIKYIKSVLWRVAKRLSYTEEARCLKVNDATLTELCADGSRSRRKKNILYIRFKKNL